MPARRWTLMLMLNLDAPRNCPSEQLYQRAAHELNSPLVGQARAGPKVVVQDPPAPAHDVVQQDPIVPISLGFQLEIIVVKPKVYYAMQQTSVKGI